MSKTMVNTRQFKGRPLKRPTAFNHWLVATATLSLEELVETLSEPHYSENDQLRTAGGSEDHWAFEFDDGMRIGILFRRPYSEATFFADPPDVKKVLARIKPCLKSHEIRIADPPFLIQ